jgi:hypothetical protein
MLGIRRRGLVRVFYVGTTDMGRPPDSRLLNRHRRVVSRAAVLVCINYASQRLFRYWNCSLTP